MAAGGFFFYPLSHVLGRSSAIFWSLIGTLASQIWASQTQHRDDYTSFIVSRFFGGFFGSVVGVLGPRVLVDMFFLHQRGRAFTVFHWCFDFGTVAGPTISALIDANTSWIYAYVGTSGLVGVALILVFAFMHETTWDRRPNATNVEAPQGFLSNRIATFLPGNRVTLHTPFSDTLRISALPFKIALQPVTLIIAVYSLVNFGFYVAMNSLSPVFLQKPVAAGGYGFNTMSNALCKPYPNSPHTFMQV
jgi:MFS family permease